MKLLNILSIAVLATVSSFARQGYTEIINEHINLNQSASNSFDASQITDIGVKIELMYDIIVGGSEGSSSKNDMIVTRSTHSSLVSKEVAAMPPTGQARLTIRCSNGSVVFEQDYGFSGLVSWNVYEDGFQNPFCGNYTYSVTVTIIADDSGGNYYPYVKFSYRSGF